MTLALVIVDLDGTLVDSFDDIRDGMAVALAAIGVAPSDALLALSRRGVSLESYYQHALARDPEAPEERARFAAFVNAYVDHYQRHQKNARVYDGVFDTLDEIRSRWPRLRLAVGTNKRTDLARELAADIGLARYFDLIQGSEEVAKKPDPALLHLIARRLETPIEHALMVGDTGADVLAAQRAGCGAVAVTYGGWPRAEIETLRPDRLIDDFAELVDIVAGTSVSARG
ncbi:HAD family hydrolase [Haliangium sp.]|uniref:HAD family hydrolase n=1 Tax=Haliangium sp. TaxID=2663208 RepID=UPI003D0A0E62